MPNDELAVLLGKELNNGFDQEALEKIAGLMKERATFVRDIISEGSYLIERPKVYDKSIIEKKWKENSHEIMSEWKERLMSLTEFNGPTIEIAFKSFLEVKQLGIGAVLPLFRFLLTGTAMGPSMFEIAEYLGKDESMDRMYEGLKQMEK